MKFELFSVDTIISMKFFFTHHWGKILLGCGILLFFLPNIYILSFSGKKNFLSQETVAIVFGAGVSDAGVSDVFADRLLGGKILLEQGKVEKILISGDNRKKNYNEPEQGKRFLVSLGVPAEKIFLDYAGRRTYDTCWRAKNIFGIDDAILVTQEFHLPRALFTCDAMGISVLGFSASFQLYADAGKNILREFLAQQKSWYEVKFFFHEAEIGGEKENIFE